MLHFILLHLNSSDSPIPESDFFIRLYYAPYSYSFFTIFTYKLCPRRPMSPVSNRHHGSPLLSAALLPCHVLSCYVMFTYSSLFFWFVLFANILSLQRPLPPIRTTQHIPHPCLHHTHTHTHAPPPSPTLVHHQHLSTRHVRTAILFLPIISPPPWNALKTLKMHLKHAAHPCPSDTDIYP